MTGGATTLSASPCPGGSGVRRRRTRDGRRVAVLAVAGGMLATLAGAAQRDVTDRDLERASAGRTVRLGSPGGGPIATVPLEVYVARVLAGEGAPDAPEAAREALAIAIRTFALANPGRHGSDGFDLCDTTHCQVPRAATAASRRAAAATAGRILTWNGEPAEVFYSASCGGRTEAAAALWSRAGLPYLQSVEDDVHEGEEPWRLVLTPAEVTRALAQAGFEGTLRGIRVESRSESGRAARLALAGMRPPTIAGDAFRAAIGAAVLRSTAFDVTMIDGALNFTGRGYGHGVGLCVVGASRRARRGESARDILATYFPGLEISTLGDAPRTPRPRPFPGAR